jgi:hypothetical protein
VQDTPPEQRGDRRAWFGDLVAQVFSKRELVAAGTYAAYNIFAGIILIGFAALVLVEPRLGPATLAIAIGAAGLGMVSMLPVAYLWPRVATKLLFGHGVLFVLLALSFAADSVRWALQAPPLAAFRYIPGLVVVPLTYGALQVAAFGPRIANARRIRIAGLIAGALAEMVVAIALIVRFAK